MSETTTNRSEAEDQALRIAELGRRLAMLEALLYEIIDLLPRDRLQPRLGVLLPLLCELDGVPEDLDGDMSHLGKGPEVAP